MSRALVAQLVLLNLVTLVPAFLFVLITGQSWLLFAAMAVGPTAAV